MGIQKQHSPRGLHASGYVSKAQDLWYRFLSPVYDALVWCCFLPLGGERSARDWMADCVAAEPGHEVLSLCCGTGTTDRALLRRVPAVRITGIDLGAGQIARARHRDASRTIDYRVADASQTGCPDASFDRVIIGFALHEMPRDLRLAVLREARRVARPDGRVVAVEHAPMEPSLSRLLRYLVWLYWLPFNPEVATTRDLQRRGLAREMSEVGLDVLERRTTTPAWAEAVIARA